MMLSITIGVALAGLSTGFPGLREGVITSGAEDGDGLSFDGQESESGELLDLADVSSGVGCGLQGEGAVLLGHDEEVEEEAAQFGRLDA